MVGRAVPRPCADARRLLLQPAGGRLARHDRSAEAHVSEATPLLAVSNLSVEFRTRSGIVRALEKVGFEVARGETIALVGESGSGKSVTAYALLGLLDPAARITSGHIMFGGADLRGLGEAALSEL